MEVYSVTRKKKILSLLSALSLLDEKGAVIDSPDAFYDGEGPVFVLSKEYERSSDDIKCYDVIRSLGGDLYSDSLKPSVVFSYPDFETAELAYKLSSFYGISLNTLRDVHLESDSYYRVHSAHEIKKIISSRSSHFRMLVIFSSQSYPDPITLASAFQNIDILFLLSNGTEEEKKFKKALERIIFSPTVKRLSAVIDIKSTDDIVDLITPSDVIFEIELLED